MKTNTQRNSTEQSPAPSTKEIKQIQCPELDTDLDKLAMKDIVEPIIEI